MIINYIIMLIKSCLCCNKDFYKNNYENHVLSCEIKLASRLLHLLKHIYSTWGHQVVSIKSYLGDFCDSTSCYKTVSDKTWHTEHNFVIHRLLKRYYVFNTNDIGPLDEISFELIESLRANHNNANYYEFMQLLDYINIVKRIVLS